VTLDSHLGAPTTKAAGYGFVGTKTFPDLDWAGDTALYEKQLPSETAVASES
jgi:hypothetical protein